MATQEIGDGGVWAGGYTLFLDAFSTTDEGFATGRELIGDGHTWGNGLLLLQFVYSHVRLE